MTSITQTLSQEHHACDILFAQLETQVTNANWPTVITKLGNFLTAMEQHFTYEEQILFPALEKHTGPTLGPTQVMRLEHQQMRQLFQEMQESVTQQDRNQYLGLSETLLMLMRQHNAKEEQILYPMCDHTLNGVVAKLLEHR